MDYNGHGTYKGSDGEDKSDIHPDELIVVIEEAILEVKAKEDKKIAGLKSTLLKQNTRLNSLKKSIDSLEKERVASSNTQRDALTDGAAGTKSIGFYYGKKAAKQRTEKTKLQNKEDSIQIEKEKTETQLKNFTKNR